MLQIYDWFPLEKFHLKDKCIIFFVKVPFVLQKILMKQVQNPFQLCTFLFTLGLCGSLSWQLLLLPAVEVFRGPIR